jgi:haloacetate dehalogenase
MDTDDKNRKLEMPLMLLWGADVHPSVRSALDIWREYASSIEAWDPLNRGHCMQEEMPEEIYGHFMKFFAA